MTVGQRLRASREAEGMSIGEVARRTYIQPKFIQAIEDDDLSVLPESHRRLFVREFAKCVGMSADELLATMPEVVSPPPPAPPQSIDTDAKRRLFRQRSDAPPKERTTSRPSPTSDDGPSAYSDFLSRLSRGRGIKLGKGNTQTWLIASALVLLVAVVAYYAFFSKRASSSGTTALHDTASSPTQVLSRGDADDTTLSDGFVSGDSLTLEGRATAKIWFAIVMDGRRSETDTLDSGSVRIWRASKTFKLSLGNAGGLQLSLNDRRLGTLGALHTSIRNQIIDSAGVRHAGSHRPAPAAAPVPATPPAGNAAPPARSPATTPRRTTPTATTPAATNNASRPATSSTSRPSRPATTPRRQPRRQPLPRVITPTEVRTAPPN